MTRRTERLNSLIRREISELLRQQVNDPRLGSLISVTSVSTSPDLQRAKVFVSTLGDEANRSETLRGFTAASGFLRRELARRLGLRQTPELSFHFDDSIERGTEVVTLIEQLTYDSSQDEDGN